MRKIALIAFTVLISFQILAQVPNYVPTNGLVGWWPFNGNANDESGNGNNGTVNGATLTTDRSGNANKAFSFDGVKDFISVSHSQVLNLPGNNKSFTIAAWIKPNQTGKQELNFISKGQGNGANSNDVYIFSVYNQSKIGLELANFPNAFWTISSSNINFNQWNHLVVVYDNNLNQSNFYINGTFAGQQQYPFTPSSNGDSQPLFFGKQGWNCNCNFFNGLIDDIGSWNRALTSQEITTLYKGKKCSLINSATFNVPNATQTIQTSDFTTINNNRCILDTGKWIYIAYTKNANNTAKLYKNGVLQATGNYLNLNYSWNRIDIGAEFFTSYNHWFNGRVDEMRVSNSERTALEIQNNFNSNSPFIQDSNTIGLYHFDENSGTTTNGLAGPVGSIINAQWAAGKFGSSLKYNGINTRTEINLSVPTNNYTMEFWIFIPDYQRSTVISTYGSNTNSFGLIKDSVQTNYTWSTGATGNSITVDPSSLPYIWVTDGNCADTIWFNSNYIKTTDTCIVKINDTVKITKYDTVKVTRYDTIKVTDTLVINAILSGVSAPNNTNRLLIYPNPAKDHITIDYGVFGRMSGYTLKIVNTLGQIVFSTPINQQTSYINLSTWTGKGMYYVQIYDASNTLTENRKIVLQ
jgi:hypothetical protein